LETSACATHETKIAPTTEEETRRGSKTNEPNRGPEVGERWEKGRRAGVRSVALCLTGREAPGNGERTHHQNTPTNTDRAVSTSCLVRPGGLHQSSRPDQPLMRLTLPRGRRVGCLSRALPGLLAHLWIFSSSPTATLGFWVVTMGLAG
jgi:hypothetical protein